MLCFDPNLKKVVACLLRLILNYTRNLGGSCIKLRPRCGSIGHLGLCPSVGLKAFNQTVTDEMSLGADVWQGQKRKDNVSLVLLDNETQEAAHSSSCTQAGIFEIRMPNALEVWTIPCMQSKQNDHIKNNLASVLNCFRADLEWVSKCTSCPARTPKRRCHRNSQVPQLYCTKVEVGKPDYIET